jgi:hypothetical protein
MESSRRRASRSPGSIMANHDGPSPVRAVEGNLSGLSRRLKAAANVLDAAVPPQRDWRTRSAVQPIPMSSVA